MKIHRNQPGSQQIITRQKLKKLNKGYLEVRTKKQLPVFELMVGSISRKAYYRTSHNGFQGLVSDTKFFTRSVIFGNKGL